MFEMTMGSAAQPRTFPRSGCAGLPLLLETMMALHVGQAIQQHLKLRKRNAGISEVEMVEDFVPLLGAGGGDSTLK